MRQLLMVKDNFRSRLGTAYMRFEDPREGLRDAIKTGRESLAVLYVAEALEDIYNKLDELKAQVTQEAPKKQAAPKATAKPEPEPSGD